MPYNDVGSINILNQIRREKRREDPAAEAVAEEYRDVIL
jgi:hypothetical protein